MVLRQGSNGGSVLGSPVRVMRQRGVGHLVMSGTPGNPLDSEMRSALMQGLDSLLADDGIAGIVLSGQGPHFSVGLPLAEAATQGAAPTVSDIAARIESAQVPVVAALKGRAQGAAFELALAAHRRVATPTAQIGLPQARLGLVPGAGGTQRLPRIIGAEAALAIMLDQRALPAFAARQSGLIDILSNDTPETAAEDMVLALREGGKPLVTTRNRREGLADGRAFIAAIKARRAALAKSPLTAPGKIVDCVEAALLLPFEAGLEFEAQVLADAAADPQSEALCHLSEAETAAAGRLFSRDNRGQLAFDRGAADKALERLQAAMETAVEHLRGLGARAPRIDAALVGFGFALGPFGGRETAPEGRDTLPIRRRVIAALMAEGARLVEEGAVARLRDIDVMAVHGMGFPRWRGGPMKAAQAMGLEGLSRDMALWAKQNPIWAPPPLVTQAANHPQGFAALDRLRA